MGQVLDDAPSELIEQARLKLRAEHAANTHDEQGRRLARRIFVSFALLLLLGVVFFVVLPLVGMTLPPIVPLASFAAIVVGAVMTHSSEAPPKPKTDRPLDQARAVGCCSGPGHMRCVCKPTDAER